MLSQKWTTLLEPKGQDPKKQSYDGGLIVYITNGDQKEEVSRVAFIRKDSENPKMSFEEALRQEMDKAEEACKKVNDAIDDVTAVIQKMRDEAQAAQSQTAVLQ